MTWRGIITSFLVLFVAVVSSSFGYGLFLLFRERGHAGPRRPAAVAAAQIPNLKERLDEAQEHLKKGETEQAILVYRRILAVGASFEAQLGLAEGELQSGREDLAAREYERVLRMDGRHAIALLRLGRIYSHEQETWPQSEARYRAYLAVRPNEADAELGLARALAWQGKSADAADVFGRGRVQKVMTEQDHRDYAFALVRARRIEAAEPLIRKLLAARPDDYDLRLQQASLHALREDWDKALPQYRALLAERPNDPRTNLVYGQGLLALEHHEAAVAPLGKAARALPSSGEAGLAHARALRGAGDPKRAAQEYERVMPHYERDAVVTREYADLLVERREYGKAENYYRQALDLGLRDDRLLLGLAGALQANGKPREALPLLEAAYTRQPTDRLAFELAKLYRRLGRSDRALELLKKVER